MPHSQLVSAPQEGVAWWPEVATVMTLPFVTFGFSWWSIGSFVADAPPGADSVALGYLSSPPTLSGSASATIGVSCLLGFIGLLALFTERCRKHSHLNGWWPAMSAAVFAATVSAWAVRAVPATAAAATPSSIRFLATIPVILGLVAWAASNRGHTRLWQRYLRPRALR
ncbi:MAG: hypothetical protein GXP35_18340 [Actinobacteria bacterium]|nr:hypothetical protein [Actinomycetota bacterium]